MLLFVWEIHFFLSCGRCFQLWRRNSNALMYSSNAAMSILALFPESTLLISRRRRLLFVWLWIPVGIQREKRLHLSHWIKTRMCMFLIQTVCFGMMYDRSFSSSGMMWMNAITVQKLLLFQDSEQICIIKSFKSISSYVVLVNWRFLSFAGITACEACSIIVFSVFSNVQEVPLKQTCAHGHKSPSWLAKVHITLINTHFLCSRLSSLYELSQHTVTKLQIYLGKVSSSAVTLVFNFFRSKYVSVWHWPVDYLLASDILKSVII